MYLLNMHAKVQNTCGKASQPGFSVSKFNGFPREQEKA